MEGRADKHLPHKSRDHLPHYSIARIASQKPSKICLRITFFSASFFEAATRPQARLSSSCRPENQTID